MTHQIDEKEAEKIDPLRRIFIPIEKRMTNGEMTFRTMDKEQYIRAANGVIRRKYPKKRREKK